MKYIIVKDDNRREQAIVFPDLLNHNEVGHRFRNDRIVSAGFCSYFDGVWQASGKSETLQIGSRPEDAQVIERSFSDIL